MVENAKAGDTNVYKKADSFLFFSSSHYKSQREEDPHSPHYFFPFFFPIFFPRKERKTKKKDKKKERDNKKIREKEKRERQKP